MKSCTSRTVFFELLRITPLTLPSGSAATFSILRTLSACCCEKTACASDGFGQKLKIKPTNTETTTVRLWVDFDENVVMSPPILFYKFSLRRLDQRKCEPAPTLLPSMRCRAA